MNTKFKILSLSSLIPIIIIGFILIAPYVQGSTINHDVGKLEINTAYLNFIKNCNGYVLTANFDNYSHSLCITNEIAYKIIGNEAKQLGAKELVQKSGSYP